MNATRRLKTLSVAIACLLTLSGMPAFADSTTIKIGTNKNMSAQLLTPDDHERHPAILVLHTSHGMEPADMAYAKRLVEEGYVVLVPYFLDAYGIKPKMRQNAFTTYAQPIYADLVAGLEELRNNEHVDGKKLGAIGFSNGGYFALWLAATSKIQSGISYYGAVTGAGTDRTLNRFRESFSRASSPTLILHGTMDSTVPVEKAIELDALLTELQAPHEFSQYPDAGHGFERVGGASNEAAALNAWQKTQVFLRDTLRK